MVGVENFNLNNKEKAEKLDETYFNRRWVSEGYNGG